MEFPYPSEDPSGLTPEERHAYDLLDQAYQAIVGLFQNPPEITDLITVNLHMRALQDMVTANVVARMNPSQHRLLGHDWTREP